jgi:predicted ArsR family transcriptional regulator
VGLEAQAAGIGSLAEPVRRALYEYVVAQSRPVGREEAAVAVDVPGHKANFHLDRLVDEGLLEVEFRRLTERTGPGAGRPAKLYRRSDREWAVSLPPRRYDLVGHILATGVERARRDSMPVDDALHEAARTEGTGIGDEARSLPGSPSLSDVLANQGYEPRTKDGAMVLANCPFDSLAQDHTALICGLNCSFVQGVVDGLGRDDVTACLQPRSGHCCVTLHSSADPATATRHRWKAQ